MVGPGQRFQTGFDEEEEILMLAVIDRTQDFGAVEVVQRLEAGARGGIGDDALPRQHQSVGVMDFEQASKKKRCASRKL